MRALRSWLERAGDGLRSVEVWQPEAWEASAHEELKRAALW